MNIQALYSLLANLILLLALCARVSPARWRWATVSRLKAGLLLLILFGLAFFTATIYVGPSVSLTITGFAYLLRMPLRLSPYTQLAIGIGGVAFLCNALGMGDFDLYGIGFAPSSGLILAVSLIGVLCLAFSPALAAIIGCAGLAFAAGLFDNLWDALLDPVLIVFCLVRGVRGMFSSRCTDGTHGTRDPDSRRVGSEA